MSTTFKVRRDTAANWTSANPTLASGEPGYELDTRKIKYGDGTTAWATLPYTASSVAWGQITGTLASQTDLSSALAGKLATASNLSDLASASTARTNLGLGTLATQSGTFSGTSSGTNTGDQTTISGNAGTATKLATARSIAMTGDVSWTVAAFDGSANVTAAGTIGANAVTFGKFVAATQAAFVGATVAGNFGELTPTQATAQLNVFSSTLKGLAPLSGGGTANFLRADGTWAAPPSGAGTVTSASVTSANGFAGTVATATTTPAITISTTITGLLKGNGTALSAATAATDYIAPSAYASANGHTMATARLLGRTTAATGAAEEISVAGGLTLTGGILTAPSSISGNAGTATKLATARNINGVAFDGSAAITIPAVTSVSVTTANGVSGTVATSTTTPAITLALGAITPTSVAATGTVAGSSFVSTTAAITIKETGGAIRFFWDGASNLSVGGNFPSVTGLYNTAIGFNAGLSLTSATGSTFVGIGSGQSITSAAGCTLIGKLAGNSIVSNSNNTIIGVHSGSSSMVSNVLIADGGGTPRFWYDGTNTTINTGAILPATDNASPLGSSSLRFSTVYAGTGTINTSDATLKVIRTTQVSDAEKAWAAAIKVVPYQFKDAVAEKGGYKARIHFGVLAQDVYAAGITAGILDPFQYAFLCRDMLVETADDGTTSPILDASGEQVIRWGIRYDELVMFMIACK
jgi:hypothetical protein